MPRVFRILVNEKNHHVVQPKIAVQPHAKAAKELGLVISENLRIHHPADEYVPLVFSLGLCGLSPNSETGSREFR